MAPLLNLLPLQLPDSLLLHPHLDHVPPLHALEPILQEGALRGEVSQIASQLV